MDSALWGVEPTRAQESEGMCQSPFSDPTDSGESGSTLSRAQSAWGYTFASFVESGKGLAPMPAVGMW